MGVLSLISMNPANVRADTNVGGGLWSTVEVQVGFICANLPHTRPLVIRLLQKLHLRKDHSSASNGAFPQFRGHGYFSRGTTRSRRDTDAFEMLDDKPVANVKSGGGGAVGLEESEDSTGEGGSNQAYNFDHNLTSRAVSLGRDGHQIAVRTEMAQEVQETQGIEPSGMGVGFGWAIHNMSTEISASKTRD